MELVFLGTGSAAPSATRNVSALALRLSTGIWLFDCGEATQHQLQKTTLKLGKVQRIFLTHMHGDHLFGLPGLMCTLSAARGNAAAQSGTPASSSASSSSASLAGRVAGVDLSADAGQTLELVGPPGLRQYVRTSLKLSHSFLSYQYVVHELHTSETIAQQGDPSKEETFGTELPGQNLIPSDPRSPWIIPSELPGPTVLARPIRHSVPTVGYVIQEAPLPGKLDVEAIKPQLERNKQALQAAGVKNPMALLAKVKNGEAVALPDGTRLDPKDFVGPEKPGKKLTILGDTCDPSEIREWALDSDLLVHEATNACLACDAGRSTQEEVQATAIDHGHSTPEMAGRFGREIQAKCLLLTHFSQRYKGDEDPESLATMEEIRQLAKKEFNRDREGGEAEVLIARDLASFWVK